MKKVILSNLFLWTALSIFSQPPSVDNVKETSRTQSRDLSIPESRIVINPFDFNQKSETTHSSYSNRPSLPLNTGYLTTEKVSGRKANNLLLLYRYDSAAGAAREASSYHTAWTPNELPFDAVYEDGSSLAGTDFFYDVNTLVRRVKLTDAGNGNKFLLAGICNGQTVTFENQALIQNKGIYKVAISANAFEHFPVRFFNSLQDMKLQTNGQTAPSGNGYWSVLIDATQLDNLIVSVLFSYKGAGVPVIDCVKAPLSANKAEEGYEARKKYWNDYLAKIPQPSSFNIETTQNKDVLAEDIRLAYYKAWTFVASNLLPSDPILFPYPQTVTGKASMWDEGHDLAPYSATWESFFGIQLLAFTDTENAWKAFEGIMSLVDGDGMIGGESLPSRKTQTAWLLYEMTGDKNRLEAIYEPLERYLNWRMKYPHWIYHSEADVRQKDTEFVFSAIADMGFMSKIALTVKSEAEATEWQRKAQSFYEECLPWFWTSTKSLPMQYYNTESHERSAGNRYWVTSGLYLEQLAGDYLQTMMNLFSLGFSDANNFGSSTMGLPKYPDVSYTVYGLLDKGQYVKAEKVIDVCLRDIVRSGNWFSEQYSTTGVPYPSGVRPSLFGAAMMIDFVMMKNGFRYGNGTPMAVNIFDRAGSLSGIHFGDREINISRNAAGDLLISGSYAGNAYAQPSERGKSYAINRQEGADIQFPDLQKPFHITRENGHSYIQFYSAINEPVAILIRDAAGKTIKQFSAQSVSPATRFPVNFSEKGIYLVVLETGRLRYTEKYIN
jgi:hypothetical protein